MTVLISICAISRACDLSDIDVQWKNCRVDWWRVIDRVFD